MPLGRFDEIILPVSDLDAAIAQYEAVGFRVVGQDVWGNALMQRAELRVGLASAANLSRPCLKFQVDGLAGVQAELEAAGFTAGGEPASTAAGDRGQHMVDSSGNDFFIWQSVEPVEIENEYV